ncbi:hypothetical protein Tco_0502846 [Tanacetum coccineum]
MISVVSILEGFTNEPPLEENDDLFDLESKMNEWKKILYDDPIDDLIFDPRGIYDESMLFLDLIFHNNTMDDFYYSEGDVLYLESLLSDDTTPSPPPEVFLDRDPRSLRDINDLKIMVKVFDPGIHETIFFSNIGTGEPSSLFNFEEVMRIPHNNMGPPPAGPPPPNNNGPPLMVRPNGQAPRSMEELCQPSIDGRGGPIAPIPIQAMNFGLRHHMIQQVQNS